MILLMVPGTGHPKTDMDSNNPIPNTGLSDIIQDGTDTTVKLNTADGKPKIPRKSTWLKAWAPDQKKTVATQCDPSALYVSD